MIQDCQRQSSWAAEHHESARDDGGEERSPGELGASYGERKAGAAHASPSRSGDSAPRRRRDARKRESL